MSNNNHDEMEARRIKTLDDLFFPGFDAAQIKYLRELLYIYERDRLALVPEEKSFQFYMLQYNSLKSMESVLQYLLALDGRLRNKTGELRSNPVNPNSEDHGSEEEMRNYFSSVKDDNNSF